MPMRELRFNLAIFLKKQTPPPLYRPLSCTINLKYYGSLIFPKVNSNRLGGKSAYNLLDTNSVILFHSIVRSRSCHRKK